MGKGAEEALGNTKLPKTASEETCQCVSTGDSQVFKLDNLTALTYYMNYTDQMAVPTLKFTFTEWSITSIVMTITLTLGIFVLYFWRQLFVKTFDENVTMSKQEPLRILFATEYLPPYISGIANRCKNWINGYRSKGHQVTVFSIAGSECDHIVPSIVNPFYNRQRTFILPPLGLFLELINPFVSVPYDIAHIVAPTCFSFIPLLPFMWLRGIKIYISYHVFLEYYAPLYLGDKSTFLSRLFHGLAYGLFTLLYYVPLTMFADCVGIPSRTADTYVFDFSKRIHILKSGLDVNVFHPDAGSGNRSANMNSSEKLIKSSIGKTDYDITNLREIAGPNSDQGPLLVYCGRLAKEKNVSFLIKAMANPLLSKATLIVVGDGPIREDLEELASQAVGGKLVYSSNLNCSIGNRHRVIFTGMILDEKQVASFYAQADIFVSASASETFGFTVAEAMACGTPAVVVRSGAFPSVYKMIDSNMFEVGDEDRYAKCCDKVFRLLPEQSLTARTIAQNGFSIDASINDLISTYYWIIDGCKLKVQ